LADLQRAVDPHSGHPSAAGRAQDRVSSPAKYRRSANCATQPTFRYHSIITRPGQSDLTAICQRYVYCMFLSKRTRQFVCRTHIILTMRQASQKSTARRLFVGIISFNAVLVISVAFKWTVLSDNKTTAYMYSNASLHQPEYPLLCMFTSFKPDAAKTPVNM